MQMKKNIVHFGFNGYLDHIKFKRQVTLEKKNFYFVQIPSIKMAPRSVKKETVSQKVDRILKEGSFKSRSKFTIKIVRNTALDGMLLKKPKKINTRRNTESVLNHLSNFELPLKSALKKPGGQQNEDDKVPKKDVLKKVDNKPFTISGRRRSVGYLGPVASCSNTMDVAQTPVDYDSIGGSEDSTEGNLMNREDSTEPVLEPVVLCSNTLVAVQPSVDYDLIDLSEDSTIELMNRESTEPKEKEKWSVDDCFGFSPSTSTSSIYTNRSPIVAKSILESDVNYDRVCLIPEKAEKSNDDSKSMIAVRKYVNKFRQEERILTEGLRNDSVKPSKPLPALIPIQRNSYILGKSNIEDPATIEVNMNSFTGFGRLAFNDVMYGAYVGSEPDFEFGNALYFSGSSDSD